VKLNFIEKAIINSNLRAVLQRHYEAPLLERLGGTVEGGKVLEVGCGRGIGIEILFDRFKAKEVHAFDLDGAMIDEARARFAGVSSDRLKLFVGDAASIEADDESFDAVFDFAIIHHVPDWRKAVKEVSRVLRPGGRFFFEEVTTHALNRWSYRTFLDHPKKDRFSAEGFVDELERHGINVGKNFTTRFFGDIVSGVGCRTAASIGFVEAASVGDSSFDDSEVESAFATIGVQ